MPKQIGISMAVGGVALVIASMVAMNIPDYGKWFPVFLIGLRMYFSSTKMSE